MTFWAVDGIAPMQNDSPLSFVQVEFSAQRQSGGH